jgi:hypothetical protein
MGVSWGADAGVLPGKAGFPGDRWVKCPKKGLVQTALRRRINSENARLPACPSASVPLASRARRESPTQSTSRRKRSTKRQLFGLARLKKDGWIEGLGLGTRLEIHVREPGSHHVLSVQQVERWINSVNASPGETLKKAKLRQLLKS